MGLICRTLLPSPKSDRGFFTVGITAQAKALHTDLPLESHKTCDWVGNKTEVDQVPKSYILEDFPEEVRQAWGVYDEDFKEIKSQLVGKPLPPV